MANSKKRKMMSEKLSHFRNAGKDKLHLVLDFDRTLTPSRNEQGVDIVTWRFLNQRLPARARLLTEKLYSKYRPLEISGKMTVAEAITWWSSVLDLYKHAGLKWPDLAFEVQEAISARLGAKELFDVCATKGIPTIIISAGIKNVIELWCQKFEIKPALVLSTSLCLDDKGCVCGWDRNSLIHIFNKHEKGHQELSAIRRSRPNTILVGDCLEDAAMVSGSDDVLRFFIDDCRADECRAQDFHKTVLETFDMIIPGKSLAPLADIIGDIK
jgi:phosphoserine phosphatase